MRKSGHPFLAVLGHSTVDELSLVEAVYKRTKKLLRTVTKKQYARMSRNH